MTLRRLMYLVVVLWFAVFQTTASAHRVSPEVVAYFHVEGHTLRFFVRVPTAILLDARLPVVETVYLDLAATGDRLRAIAPEVSRSFDVTDNGRPLTPTLVGVRLAPLADSAFSSFASAASSITQPPIPADRFIYWNEAYADFQFDYPVPDVTHRIAARLNGLRMGGDFFQTRATYVPESRAPRTVTAFGPPQRVLFEPPLGEAVLAFLRRGIDRVLADRLLLLFIFCLAIPKRTPREALRVFGWFAFVHVLTVWTSAMTGSLLPLAPFTPDLARIAAGIALGFVDQPNHISSSFLRR